MNGKADILNRRKWIILISFFLVLTTHLKAIDIPTEIYKAYINNDMQLWSKIESRASKLNFNSVNKEFIFQLILSQYGLIAYWIGTNEEEKAENIIPDLEKNIELLLKSKYRMAEVYAIKGASLGFKIGLNTAKAPFLGPKSLHYVKLSEELDPNNPHVWIEKGNIEFYMPSIFGGSKSLALEHYIKAIALFEKKPQNLRSNWIYLSTLTSLGKTYEILNRYKEAKIIYEKILRIEPGFKWVKEDLYPNLLKKLNV